MGKVVTAAVVVVRGEDKLQRYYYQGSTLPDELPKDEVQRLVDAGMVGDDDALVAKPGDEPGMPNTDATRTDEPARPVEPAPRESKASRQTRNG